MLKPREEKFVQWLIAGLSQRKAFIEANPNAKRWKPETVDVKACHLFHQEDIQARYQELLREARERSMWTREKAEETLTWLIQQAKKQIERTGRMESATVSAIMGPVKELNEMSGVGKEDENAHDDNNLAQAMKESTQEAWNDEVSEIQQEAAQGDDMVEPSDHLSEV